jgi:hypothetical protein
MNSKYLPLLKERYLHKPNYVSQAENRGLDYEIKGITS